MTIEYRQITDDEPRTMGTAIERGFGSHYEPSDELFELDKKGLPTETTMCAFDGDELVGTSAAFPFESRVPGG